jgi:hypothetical protein
VKGLDPEVSAAHARIITGRFARKHAHRAGQL